MQAPVLQGKVPLAADQLHAQLIELEAHTAAAIDQLGEQLDHVCFRQLRGLEAGEFFTKAFYRDFTQWDPREVRSVINTNWCTHSAANHEPIRRRQACGMLRGLAGDVDRQHVGNQENRDRPVAAVSSSSVKLSALEWLVFGKNGR